ncbi:MAG: DUF805 domain-containing protein [Roseicyclus sp.]|nr:DUF805 domain-containing protein [Roseicyclus sp.]
MTFSDAIRTNTAECLNVRDRALRSAYWWFIIVVVFVTIVSFFVVSVAAPQSAEMMAIIFDPTTAMAEINTSLSSVDQVNHTSSILWGIQTLPSLLVIIWMASKGTSGPNQYGEDPLG